MHKTMPTGSPCCHGAAFVLPSKRRCASDGTRYLGERGGFIGMAGFGASGAADALYRHFGIVPATVVAEAKRLLQTRN